MKSRLRLWLWLCASGALAACGGNNNGGVCGGADGLATLGGTLSNDVETHAYGPAQRAYASLPGLQAPSQPFVIVDEAAGEQCGERSVDLHDVALVFEAEPHTGTYAAGSGVVGIAENNDANDESARSTAGTVTLDAVSDTCISGSFALTFGSAGALTGTFSAPRCGFTPPDVDAAPIDAF